MTVFYDSSALVKLYADEADADLVRDRTDIVVSALARVEVPAAFWRKQRMGEIGPGDAQILAAAFEFDYHGSRERDPRFVAIAAVAPVLEQIAAENVERLTVAKLDVDANPLTAQQYQVASIPTLIVFNGGQPVARMVGARGKSALLSELSDYL